MFRSFLSRRSPAAKRLPWIAVGLILGLGADHLGSAANAANRAETDTLYRKLEVLAEVLTSIENNYVDALTPSDLVYGAARGAVTGLDPHSDFFDPSDYQSLVNVTEGEYAGIGIELSETQGESDLVTVFEDSPAKLAGLQVGDRLVAIDDAPVRDMSFEAMQRRLRGPIGSKVKLSVLRSDRPEPWPFTVVRGWIRVAPVAATSLGDGIEYVQVKTFSRRVAHDLEVQLKKRPPTRGLVLDLRSNPGGLFDEAVQMCDLFLADGPIVSAIGRGGRIVEQQSAKPTGTERNYPIAVVIDRGSASAAEIVAGALRDRGRARLFGERSYGKGSVQSIIPLSDGSGLKLTVARYYTPSGRVIDGQGIDPDETADAKTEAPVSAAMTWIKALPSAKY
ncbi:MAG: S41 family peptidase [Clostridia bacterium]|nr:S41 family peptidase [Deltaproteobacteria bacterium]